nr:MAG TPA: integrase [Caudoviricetes sp.]
MRKFLLSFPVTYCIIKRCVVLFNISFYTLRSVPRTCKGIIVQGNHHPLIPKEIFLKVNGELFKNHSGYEQKIDKEYAPLLGSIKCPCCGNNLSASISTKMRKKFGRTDIGYYVCSRKGCKYNSSTKNVHEAFEEEVNKYSLSDKVSELLKHN